MSKPVGPETYEVVKGAGFWPELRYVPRSNREDLEIVLRQRGRASDDFYVSDIPSRLISRRESNGMVDGPVETDVTVRSRKTGIARAYTARSGLNTGPYAEWVNEFAQDLDNGLFE